MDKQTHETHKCCRLLACQKSLHLTATQPTPLCTHLQTHQSPFPSEYHEKQNKTNKNPQDITKQIDNPWHGLLREQTLCVYNSDKGKSAELSITCRKTYNLHPTSAFSVKWGWVLPPIELKYLNLQSVWDLQGHLLQFSIGELPNSSRPISYRLIYNHPFLNKEA